MHHEIVIPVFNGERHVGPAIDSALRQTVSVPIIVVDDGSTDGTPTLLAAYGDAITVICQENAGTSAAWNTAMARSSALWLIGLDADDVLEHDAVEALVERAEARPGIDVLYSDYTFIADDDAVIREVVNPEAHDPVEQLLALHDRLGEPDNFVPFGHVRMYRRDALVEVGGYDESYRYAEDYELLLRLAVRGIRFERVPRSLYRYRWHTANKGVVRRPQQVAEVRRAVAESGLR